MEEGPQFVAAGVDREPDDGRGPAVEEVEGPDRGSGELPEQSENGEVRDVLGFAETGQQGDARGDGGRGRPGPGQLPSESAGRVHLPARQGQIGDGGADQVPVAVLNAETQETAVQGGGVVRDRTERFPDGVHRLAPGERILARSGLLRGEAVAAPERDSLGRLTQQVQGVVVQGGREGGRVALFPGAHRVGWDSIP
ncbi:hypothetical protein [Streptomyces caelestis]|uniref:hypothetical protein n=1 Tax=Streptomyces caelestis TaxID=36816 RepID=UPI003658C2EB